MRLYPLAVPVREAVIYHADIHLRPTMLNLAKLVSDILILAIGRTNLTVTLNDLHEPEYWIQGTKLLPPSARPSAWAVWGAKNRYNLWWLLDMAVQIKTEYLFRFQNGFPFGEYDLISNWIAKNLIDFVPLPQKFALHEFPLVLPSEHLLSKSTLEAKDVVSVYRNFYLKQKSEIRMRWTRRSLPHFMPETVPNNAIPM